MIIRENKKEENNKDEIVKVKEYDHLGRLLFDGEYLGDKMWNGKINKYDRYGNLAFEGEYLEGKIWNGKGKEYDKDTYMLFEGEYINGKKMDM